MKEDQFLLQLVMISVFTGLLRKGIDLARKLQTIPQPQQKMLLDSINGACQSAVYVCGCTWVQHILYVQQWANAPHVRLPVAVSKGVLCACACRLTFTPPWSPLIMPSFRLLQNV